MRITGCYAVVIGNTKEHLIASQSTVSLKLAAETKDRLRRLADARRRSPHWLMLEAIEQYVDREERVTHMRADALAAWDEYQLTGQHVTADDADAWLARLEAGETVEPPAAHE